MGAAPLRAREEMGAAELRPHAGNDRMGAAELRPHAGMGYTEVERRG